MTTTAAATRWFTPEKADKTLPLVRAIVSDIKELREAVRSRQSRVDEVLTSRPDSGSGPYHEELEAMRRSLNEDRRQIRAFISELTAIGAEIVEGDDAAVEFPAWVEGHAVRLRWSLNQPKVASWRELADPVTTCREVDSLHFTDGPEAADYTAR
ncbi:hypothetical protein Poly24_16000 [Rosistilla carotiformis]|uniref:DUF2203 domain-containing protein n=1 Tax=Rosistilla carotiformis TaxID=2528017 RepID=A0A518JQS5_9BACT|nr:DUF2203 family protein [Rosistilla carotiformis]QDV67895.1 hypothetical protein Poly24_16000 [Rosistilla carotiformis]